MWVPHFYSCGILHTRRSDYVFVETRMEDEHGLITNICEIKACWPYLVQESNHRVYVSHGHVMREPHFYCCGTLHTRRSDCVYIEMQMENEHLLIMNICEIKHVGPILFESPPCIMSIYDILNYVCKIRAHSSWIPTLPSTGIFIPSSSRIRTNSFRSRIIISPLTDADVGHPQITATTTATAAGDAG